MQLTRENEISNDFVRAGPRKKSWAKREWAKHLHTHIYIQRGNALNGMKKKNLM